MDKDLLNKQSQHWENNFSNKPEMFGVSPSDPDSYTLEIFKKNHVKNIYNDFSPEQISFKMSEMLIDKNSNVELDIIFQKVENLHKACKNHKGDWYFTGNYPTQGGNKVVNQAFINYVEGNSQRAY